MLTDDERNHLLSIADTVASLHAVDADYRRGHCIAAAERIRAIAAHRVATVARPIAEWHEDHGPALWWRFPVNEPPYSGSPLDDDWPGYHTHWTPIVCPVDPASRGPIGEG